MTKVKMQNKNWLKELKGKLCREASVIAGVIGIAVMLGIIGVFVTRSFAGYPLVWTQTDWSGGEFPFGEITTDTNTFYSQTGADYYLTPGSLKILRDSFNYYDWQYRRPFYFDNTDANLGVTSETLSLFPVLLRLTDGVNVDYSKTNNDGSDIRFEDSNGNPLNYDIEVWNEAGESLVWVNVTQITANSNTDYIYMYYGNPSASSGEYTPNVWNNSFNGVWHLEETGTAAAGEYKDSTGYAAHGQGGSGTLANTPTVDASGVIANAQSFDGTDHIKLSSASQFNILNQITVSTWIKTSDSGTNRSFIGRYYTDGNYQYRLSMNTTGNILFERGNFSNGSGGTTIITSSNTVNDGNWHHVVGRYDGTTAKIYIDTVEVATITETRTAGTSTQEMCFGDDNLVCTSAFSNSPWIGSIDEIRLASVARGVGWIGAEYKTATNDFIASVGTEEEFYSATASLTSNVFDTSFPSEWGTINFAYTPAANTTVTVKVRTGNQVDMSDATDFSTCNAVSTGADISSNNCVTDSHRYVQYQIEFTSDGTATPTFESISINYSSSDNTAPTDNATSFGVTGLGSGNWTSIEPTISWNAGADDIGGLGLLGYCLSIEEANVGQSTSLDPAVTAGILSGIDDGVDRTFCEYITTSTTIDLSTVPGLSLTNGKQYNFSIKAVDIGGNIYDGVANTYQDVVIFKYDILAPVQPSFISVPGNFVSNKAVTFTWETAGSDAASDADSGVEGLQYRIGPSGTWYGDLHTATQDINDLLTNDGEYTMDATYDFPALIEGINELYVRSVDKAGNVSTEYATGLIKINTVAPSSPRNLEVTPATNTTNAYTFEWDAPTTYSGSPSGLTYCYSVNVLPAESNCSFTSGGAVSIGPDAFATQPGENIFYLVARDEALNINYGTYVFVSFSYDGSAPGIPTSVDIADISVKAISSWKLAVSWGAPVSLGAGVSSYKVYRSTIDGAVCSTDIGDFTEIGTTAGTSYVDTGLSQTTYSYCVRACDSANNCSAVSSTVSKLPTGKFLVPANLISGPDADQITTSKAVVTWVTDRDSDSRVEYGLSSGNYFESEFADTEQTSAHSVTLSNLKAGTTYYYRAKWTDEDGNTGISDEKVFKTDPAPEIENVVDSSITVSSALVSFTSTNATSVNVYYGPNKTFGGINSISTSAQTGRYTVRLTGLQDDTVYSYRVNPVDSEGREYEGEIHSFQTLPRPKISNVVVTEQKEKASPTVNVTWDTNIATTSILTYYPLSNIADVRSAVDVNMVQGAHGLTVSGLLAETDYKLVVKATDRFGNQTVSEELSFRTASDSRPPLISNIRIEGTILTGENVSEEKSAQIVVAWDTDEPSTSQVEFGEGSGVTYTQLSEEDSNLSSNHVVIISNLGPSKVYHLRVISTDSAGNTGRSTDQVTITPKSTNDLLELILGTLGDAFGIN